MKLPNQPPTISTVKIFSFMVQSPLCITHSKTYSHLFIYLHVSLARQWFFCFLVFGVFFSTNSQLIDVPWIHWNNLFTELQLYNLDRIPFSWLASLNPSLYTCHCSYEAFLNSAFHSVPLSRHKIFWLIVRFCEALLCITLQTPGGYEDSCVFMTFEFLLELSRILHISWCS